MILSVQKMLHISAIVPVPNRISESFLPAIKRLALLIVCLSLLIGTSEDIAAQQADPANLEQQQGEQQQTEETGTDADPPITGQTEARSEQPGQAIAESLDPKASTPDPVSQNWAKADFAGFIDIRQRLQPPRQELLDKGLRVVTSDDYPPFNSRDNNGRPFGYHVEMVKFFCEELNIACTLKIVPFGEIPQLLASGKADMALAGLANHASLRQMIGFSMPYLQRPARFVARSKAGLTVGDSRLAGKSVAVRGQSAHEAYIKSYFPDIRRVPVADMALAKELLEEDKVDAIFGDVFQLLPHLKTENDNLAFIGEAYYDSHFFGQGMSIAYERQQDGLGQMIDYGLLKLAQKGRLAELYARHFALDVF